LDKYYAKRIFNVLNFKFDLIELFFAQDNVTYTGSMGGDIFIWKDNVLVRTVSRAHQGPIFSMYTCLFDGCIVTGAKEKK
jgi:hypothetical protein